MNFFLRCISQIAFVLTTAASPLTAQNLSGADLTLSGSITQNGSGTNFFNGSNNTFNGRACLGPSCDGSEPFEQGPLRLKWSEPDILFEDSSSSAGISSNDWRLVINDFTVSKFAVQDIDGGTFPFTIDGGTPDNTLWLDDTGNVGLGTALPQQRLHITRSGEAGIRLEDNGGTAYAWDLRGNSFGLYVYDPQTADIPFEIRAGAPNGAFYAAENGYIGLGTRTPDAPLEVSDDETFSFFRITATGAGKNQSADVVFTQGPLGTGEFRYNIVDGDGPEMRLNANGDVIVDGTLTTGGPTCASGCDTVFDGDFERLSIEEHAALMWEKGHLPAVGPTVPGAPMNVAEKLGNILNELEHAHIYIDDQQKQIAELTARNTALAARLSRIEAVLLQLEE
ncbi:hypothetical protein [Roseovarius aestuariivivens]|uniref:hypothetical protein n=1 Tax=Roseovarius aestuariivivens TaxID=1888910 RepID=UPI0010803427|nr:hypothetical protein [Roseovarius aestuariivivens]